MKFSNKKVSRTPKVIEESGGWYKYQIDEIKKQNFLFLNKDKMNYSHLFLCFEAFVAVEAHVINDGGDGCGYILSPQWKIIAELFKEYTEWFTEEIANIDSLTFYRNIECVVIGEANIPVIDNPSCVIELNLYTGANNCD